MRYLVRGADRETGQLIECVYDACSAADAEERAVRDGMLVESSRIDYGPEGDAMRAVRTDKVLGIMGLAVVAWIVLIPMITRSFQQPAASVTPAQRSVPRVQWVRLSHNDMIQEGVTFLDSSWSVVGTDKTGALLSWKVRIKNLSGNTVGLTVRPVWLTHEGLVDRTGETHIGWWVLGERTESFAERIRYGDVGDDDELVIQIKR